MTLLIECCVPLPSVANDLALFDTVVVVVIFFFSRQNIRFVRLFGSIFFCWLIPFNNGRLIKGLFKFYSVLLYCHYYCRSILELSTKENFPNLLLP